MLIKRAFFGGITLLVGVVVALVCAEALATGWYWLRDGKYTPASEMFASAGNNSYINDVTGDRACRYVDTLFPHPYLAFVHHRDGPCGMPNANNVGMTGDDYPLVKPDDRYVVLLTGGSVAAQMGQNRPPPAPKFLEEALNANYVSPTGKPFLVLNGGGGAWKQPQQTILLTLFGDVVDAVVTLDGFNEQLMFKPGLKLRLDTPGPNFFDINPLVAQGSFGSVVTSWLAGEAAALAGAGPLRYSHAAYLVSTAFSSLAARPESGIASGTFWRMFLLPQSMSNDAEFDWQLVQYRKYIRIMNASAQALGIRSMFFLQPVPATGKVLTEQEQKVSGDLSYGPRYIRIVDDLVKLNGDGIPVRSLLDVFESQKGTIYEDWIHAYRTPAGDSPGYRVMAEAMAREMAKGWGFKRKDGTQ